MSENSFQELKNRSLFAKLKRLFSNDVVVRNVGGKKLKVIDTDEVQYATDRNSLRDRFNRLRTTSYNQYSRDFNLSYQASRTELFRDFDTMDMDPILSSAVDIYADECTSKNELGDILTIKTPNDEIKNILHNLFYDILNIEFNMWSWVRSLVKYGDFYLKLHISPEYGVYLVEPLSPYYVTRVENSDLTNKNYIKFNINLPGGNSVEDVENYQMAHFRLLSDSNFLPYGKSMLEGARRVWKQLSLMEDAMLIHRIMRAPEKRVFKVDIGNIPPNEVDNYMERIVSQMKKVPYIDNDTGDYNLRFNMQNSIEDFFLPVRGSDSGTSIENLSGLEWTSTEDIEYLRNKMMAALKIPKAFLGYEADLSGKSTLAAEDIRFARTIQRIQSIILSELNKIAVVHLYSQGYRDQELVDFSLSLTNPSTIFEKEKIEIWKSKIELVSDMQEQKMFSKKWIYENVFNMSDTDMSVLQKQLIDDSKGKYRFDQIESEGKDPAVEFLKGKSEDSDAGVEDSGVGMEDDDSGTVEPMGDMGDDTGEESTPTDDTPSDDTPSGDEPPLNEKKKKKKRDQRGRKKASKYPFGEDPLGSLENNSKSDLSVDHSYSKSSPLSLEHYKNLMDGIDSHNKELIEENKKYGNSSSFMDEINIKE